MFARSLRTAATTVALALVAAFFLSAGAAQAKAAEPAPKAAAPLTTLKKAPARTRGADDRDLFACHPKEDLACTVVHETARGVVVVTFRPSGTKPSRVWSVVNASAAPSADSTVGTIYIVPTVDTQRVSDERPQLRLSANDSPILD